MIYSSVTNVRVCASPARPDFISFRRSAGRGLCGVRAFATPAHSGKLPLERLFAAPDLSGPTLRGVKISPNGKLIAYLKGRDDDKDRYDLWAYDVSAARHRLLVDSRTLAGADRALSAEEEARRERQRTSAFSGIVEYSFAPDDRHLLIPLNGDLYVYDLARSGADAVRRLTTTDAYETDARFSPRSHYVSFIRDQNLFVIDLANGTERAITREGGGLVSFGMAEFIAQEEMDRDTGYWWSPDERRIALARVDEAPVAEVERFEIQATGASIVRQRYPATGAANARVDLLVAELASDTLLPLDLGANHDIYLPRVDWFPDSRSIAVQRQSRDQKTLELLRFDAITGRSRVLLTERSEHWVPLHRELTFLQKHATVHLGVVARRLSAPVPVRQRRQADPASSRRANSWWWEPARIPRYAPSTSARAACISRPICPRPWNGSCSGCRWTRRASRSA